MMIYEGKPSMWRNYPVSCLIAIGLTIFTFGIGIIAFIPLWLRCVNTKLTITDEKVSLRTGVLSKKVSEVYHTDIRSVNFIQNVAQRIMGTGTIEIGTAGTSGMEIRVSGLSNTGQIKQILEEQRRKVKSA
jgi:uncharacterized membrane protein YdbT with pleckstrin-like domain